MTIHHRPARQRAPARTAARWGLALIWVAAAGPAAAASATLPSTSAYCLAYGGCWSENWAGTTLSLPQFNTDVGVLTGARFDFSSGASQLSYSSSRDGYAEAEQLLSFGSIYRYAYKSTSSATALTDLSTSVALDATALPSLIGTGTLSASYSTNVSVTKTGTSTWSRSGATGTVSSHAVNASLSYSSLGHANASFAAGADVNTLTLAAGSGYTIWALGDPRDTTRMDTVSLRCTAGDCDAFRVNFYEAQNLRAGGWVGGTTVFLGRELGRTYNATYTVVYTDDDAVGLGQRQNVLTMNLTNPVSTVPEPGTTALMLAGLAALGVRRRRRPA